MEARHEVFADKSGSASLLYSNGISIGWVTDPNADTWAQAQNRARRGTTAYGLSVGLCDHQDLQATGKIRIQDWSRNLHEPPCFVPNSAHYEIPHKALTDFAHARARPDYHGLTVTGEAVDLVLLGLSQALLPSLRQPETADCTYVTNICQAILTHLVERYGGVYFATKSKGALAPWQERRAAEFLVAHLDEPFSLVELASVCELSRSYFIKAFKETFGKTPHRWLMDYRIAQSKQMLANNIPMAEIALACGFSDQSHMSRVFASYTGMSPGRYRKHHVGE